MQVRRGLMKDDTKEKKAKEPASVGHKILTVVGIVLCIILIPVLIVNVTLLIKGFVNKDEVPGFLGYSPLIVLTDSMEPTIKSGDLIVVKAIDANDVKEGDVISFFDPKSSGSAVVTHRVLIKRTEGDGLPVFFNIENAPGIVEEDGKRVFYTQGDGNNTPDGVPVPAEKFVGVWTGTRLAGVGRFALWMQSTTGLIVCIAVPIILLVAYDIIRRRMYDKSQKKDTDDLLKELEELKKAQSAGAGAAQQASPGNVQPGNAKPENTQPANTAPVNSMPENVPGAGAPGADAPQTDNAPTAD